MLRTVERVAGMIIAAPAPIATRQKTSSVPDPAKAATPDVVPNTASPRIRKSFLP
jgi:hypothetical protein